MQDSKIIINKQEFPIQYKLMKVIASMLPGEAHYAPLAKAILTLKVPSITAELLGKGILETSDLDAIWDSGDHELRMALLEEEAFLNRISEQQVMTILESADFELLQRLAHNSEFLFISEDDEDARLSREKGREALEKLANHENAEIRRLFYSNSELPDEWVPSVKDSLQNGYEISTGQLNKLLPEEVELLAKSDRKNLLEAASWLEVVKNKKARQKLEEVLLNHPDPEIRLKLVDNPQTPKKVQEKLMNDQEKDVAEMAKRRFGND